MNAVVFSDNAQIPIRLYAADVHQISSDTEFTDNGDEVVSIFGDDLRDGDFVWQGLDIPYRLEAEANATIGIRDASLLIESGSTLYFDVDTGFRVQDQGSLSIVGTAETPFIYLGHKRSQEHGQASITRRTRLTTASRLPKLRMRAAQLLTSTGSSVPLF